MICALFYPTDLAPVLSAVQIVRADRLGMKDLRASIKTGLSARCYPETPTTPAPVRNEWEVLMGGDGGEWQCDPARLESRRIVDKVQDNPGGQ